MNKQVFVINGMGGSGKDTFVSFVSDFIPAINFSSVDKIKRIAIIVGWDGSKAEKDRKFLSDLKVLCSEYNDMPFNDMKNKVNEFLNSNMHILFLHIREPDEIRRAKKTFNAKTILIKRNNIKQITTNMADRNVYDYDYDIVINNDKELDELKSKAFCFVNDFLFDKLKNEY